MAENVNLKLTIDAKSANNAIKGLEKSFDLLKVAAGAAVAAFAGQKVIRFLESGVDAAIKQQDAMAQLGQQLKNTGEFSKTAMNGFAQFADEMEKTTKYGDDVILNQIAIAKSFGITNDKAKDLVRAATELSAATGKGLESSVKTLGNTLTGALGPLDNMIPALKGVGKEALASGAAIDIVLKRFGGSSAAELNTFQGATIQLSNAFGNLQESVGELIVNNPAMISLIKIATEGFSKLTDFVSNNSDTIKTFINSALSVLLSTLSNLAPIFKTIVGNFKAVFEAATLMAGAILQTISAFTKFGPVSAFIKSFGIGVVTMVSAVVDGLGILYAGFQGVFELVGIKAPESIVNFAELSLKIDGMAESLAYADIPKLLDDASGGLADFAESGKSAFDRIGEGIDGAGAKLKVLASEIGKAGTSIETAMPGAGGPGGGGPSPYNISGTGAQMGPGKDLMTPKAAAAAKPGLGMQLGGALASGIGGGADGAKQFLSAAAGGIADAFVPGMGQIVGPLVDTLQQGPEAVKGLVNGFADAIPDLLDNIVDAIPVLIETIADRIPDLIVAIVNAIPRIVVALVKAFSNPQLYLGIVRGLFEAFTSGLNFNVSKMTENFSKAFGKILEFDKAMREKVMNFFNNALNNFKNFDAKLKTAIADGIKNAFKGLKEAFGKAMDLNNRFKAAVDGFIKGLVDKAGDFINALVDKFKGATKASGGYIGQGVAKLKAGGGKLSEGVKGLMLTGGEGGESGLDLGGAAELEDVIGLLFQILQELKKPKKVTAVAKVNEKTFADIILNLNRRNARVTA
jgi:phage-related protein